MKLTRIRKDKLMVMTFAIIPLLGFSQANFKSEIIMKASEEQINTVDNSN